jgi:TRAP-type mannitol/chloroaromatic compound transport system substrate-binding protein
MKEVIMKKFSFITVLFLIIGLTVLFAIPNQTLAADKVFKWRCQVVYPAASPSYTGSTLRVINKIKERTNGRLIIEPYTAGSLMPSKQIFEGVERGMIECGMTSPSYMQSKIPIASFAYGLPFAFTEVWQGQYFFKWLGFEKLFADEVLKHGVYYWPDRVYATELVLKKPVTKADDFKGLKLRSSGVLLNMFKSMGASASYITGAEVYPALASGVVEGAHWGAAQGARDMGFYEICKYHLKPPLSVAAPDAWIFNKKKFDSLPDDIQKIVREILAEQFWMRSNEYIYLEGVALAEAQAKHGVQVTTISPEEMKKVRKMAQEIWIAESKKSDASKKAYDILIKFMKELGMI